MPTGGQLRIHVTILLVATLLTAVARAALAGRYALERQAINHEAWLQRSQGLTTTWGAHTFTPASAQLPELALTRLSWPSHRLTATQEASLRQRFPEVIAYLQNPRLEDYLRLKTNGLRWDFALDTRLTNEFASALGEVREPGEVVTRLWQATGSPANGLSRGQITAVCLENLSFALSHTNNQATLVHGLIAKGLTILRVAPEPGFIYSGRPMTLESGGPEELYAHFSFYARSSTSTNAGPIYLSLAWSEADQQWVPSRLMVDVLLKLEMLL